MLEYTHQLIAQIAQSAVCNRFHNARQRLARWLLMTADRVDSRELALTHEFMSYMVGGRGAQSRKRQLRCANRAQSTIGADC